jgi:hypothetical protein
MPGREALTRRFVGAYDRGSLSERFRARRWADLAGTFPDLPDMSVLDVGGDARAWTLSGLRPRRLVLLNVVEQEGLEPWMESVVADACDPPDLGEFDLAYSNAVIGHVGGHYRRLQYAETIRRHRRYWVQTAYRYFPVEPNFLVPGLQHLPRALQARVVMRWPIGNYATVKDRDRALMRLLEIELLSASELRFYFPEAEIRRDRLAGLTKSLIAVRA